MKNKIVLLIRNAAPDDFGGAETYQVSIASILSEQGYDPIIVSRSKRLREYANAHSVKTIRGWWWSRQNWTGASTLLLPIYLVWQVLLTFWYIAIVTKTGAGTLHIQSRDDFIAATFAARLTRRKAVWTDHMDLRYIFENIEQPLRNIPGKLVAFSAQFAHHIILISDNEYRLVTSHFKPQMTVMKRFVIVKNGVIDRRSEYTETPSNSDAFVFCLASRIVENKGIGEAIDAFQLFQARNPKNTAKLHIYGDGADIERFRKQAGANMNIIFFGHTNDALGAMVQSDVYILPSYQEGFSIALLEATMLGKAIIATNVDSNGEIITDNVTGLLVPPKDVQALVSAMDTLYRHQEHIQILGKASRMKYEQEFNLATKVQKELIPLYAIESAVDVPN